MTWDPSRLPDQTGRTVVVTGATAGIGYFAAEQLAAAGADVVLASRSQDKLRRAADAVRSRVPLASVRTVVLELGSSASVDAAAADLAALPRLDALLLNGGVMTMDRDATTEDGLPLILGTHVAASARLLARLLPSLVATASEHGSLSRVVHTSTGFVQMLRLRTDDLQLVSTDHCPFCMKEGHLGRVNQKPYGRNDFSKIPNGVPGVETRMPMLYDGGVRTDRISLNRFVELTSTAPAKLFGMFPKKGTIAVGSDADLVLFDPEARHVISAATQHGNTDFTLFEGRAVTGKVCKVMLRGELLVDGDRWLGRAGGGQFVTRGESGGW